MEATPENIKSIFPEFAAVSDSRIENFIEIASLSLSEKIWGSSYGTGLSYLTAHLIKRAGVGGGVQGGSSNPGVVSSEKVGELQRSYALPNFQGSSAEDSLLGTTSYGIEYLRLRRQILVTPMVT